MTEYWLHVFGWNLLCVPVIATGVDRERDFLYFDGDISERLGFSGTKKRPYRRHLKAYTRSQTEDKELGMTCVSFSGAQVLRVGQLPTKAPVWISFTQNMGHWHQGDSLTFLEHITTSLYAHLTHTLQHPKSNVWTYGHFPPTTAAITLWHTNVPHVWCFAL